MPPRKKQDEFKAKDWLQEIETAKRVKKDWRDKFNIDLAYDYWEGRQRPPDVPINEWITVNKIYSNLMAELPTLYSRDPYFYVHLATSYRTQPMDIALMEQKGKLRASMINYLKRELGLKSKIRLSIQDAHFQFGVIKTYFSVDMVENEKAGQPMVDEDGTIVFDDQSGEPLYEPESIPTREAYDATRVHPDDFLWDVDAGPLPDDWGWMAQRIKRDIEDVRKDKRYKLAVRQTVEPTEAKEDDVQRLREQRKKGTAYADKSDITPEVVVLWELYDLKRNQWFVVAEGCDDYLIDPVDLPKGIEDHPFAILRFTLRDDSPYPIPPISQQLDPQKAFCNLRSKLMTHRERFNRKYELYGPAFEDPEMAAQKLETGGDGTIVIKNQPVPGVTPIADAPLDQNHVQELIMLRTDFEELAVGSNQKGAGIGVDSATEAGIIETRSRVREGDRLSMVNDFTVDVGRKLDQLVQAYITRDQAIRVIGPEGESWQLVRTSDYESIEGEYEYTLNVGTTVPHLPDIERAQLDAFLGLIAANPMLAMSERLLRKRFELQGFDDEIIIKEIKGIAQAMLTGQLSMPGQSGSVAGTPSPATRSPSISGGMAAGINNIRGGAA